MNSNNQNTKSSNVVIPFPTQLPQEDCGICGSDNVEARLEEISFVYGQGKDATTLNTVVPVHKCLDCEFEFTGPAADRICHDAVCRHLNIVPPMKPDELCQIRKNLGLTQSKLSEITGIGIASINRWEKGSLVQSPAMDGYLYLLGEPGNLDILLRRKLEGVNVDPISLKFPDIGENIDKFQEIGRLFAL